MEVKFGTSGLRGLVADLTNPLCRKYMRAFLAHMRQSGALKQGGQVLLGRDLRASSPRLAAACAAEIATLGYKIVNCGELPTPALALAALHNHAPAVMITGSHIPDDRNGLKFYRPDGEIDKQDEAAIKVLAAADKGAAADNAALPPLPAAEDAAKAAYMRRNVEFLPQNALAGLRIGVYQHSTVSRDILAQIAADLGAEISLLHRAEKFIPVDTEALRDEDRALAGAAAAEFGLDALISADGDGDRPLLADERGQFIPGDILGILAAYYLKADWVATTITANSALEKSGFFPHISRCRIGSPYVLAAMAAAKAMGAKRIIGFEPNGGLLLGSAINGLAALPTRDAALPILSLLGLAREQGKPLSALRQLLPARFTAANRLSAYPPAAQARFLSHLATEQGQAQLAAELPLNGAKLAHIDETDGIRLIFANGEIVHFRASGNAPELRCYTEAATAERAQDLLAAGLLAAEKRRP